MTDATRRVIVEELATAADVHSFVRGHVRWVDGTPGPAVELEDIDWTTVDWNFAHTTQFSGGACQPLTESRLR